MKGKIKKVKLLIKNKNMYKEYKNNFINRNSYFLLTKISFIFNSNISIEELVELELNLSNNINNSKIGIESFKNASRYFEKNFRNCDGENFGYFMYFNGNNNIFCKNEAKNKSIYTYDNFNDLNSQKSKYYNIGITSILETKNIDFNLYIRKVLKNI